MPTVTNLIGLGIPPDLAGLLGNEPTAVTAAGSTQATATALKLESYLITMTASGADGIILPSTAKIGTPYWVFNSSGSTGLVYCPVGQTMNGSSNGSTSVATVLLAVFIQYQRAKWLSILTA